MGPHPAVAAVRLAVRRSLAGLLAADPATPPPSRPRAGPPSASTPPGLPRLTPGDLVLAACSGGADSLALAAAIAFEAPRAGLRAGGIVIDHRLQAGSAQVAATAAATMARLGLEPALSVCVQVARPGDPDYPGPEAAARAARYQALDHAAEVAGAAVIMLGHTQDDQAETVLLGLARGSGARSLAGMPGRSGHYLRPLLGLRRAQTRAACAALDLEPWDDPQNSDPAFSRARVRHELLPALEAVLGPGITEALARTARLLRADTEALDQLAAEAAVHLGAGAEGWPAADLAAQPAGIRHRILRAAALAAGCPPGALSERHIASIDELITGWHGQRWADLPGGIRCVRRYGRLLFTTSGSPGVAPRAGTAARSEEPGGRE